MTITIPALLAILALAAFLRFYRLRERGILLWDDGLRMREALFMHDLFIYLNDHLKDLLAKRASLKDIAPRFRGRFLFENPLNIILYAGMGLMTKDIDHSALLTNALFGLLGIVGVFFAGSMLLDPRTGLIAAFLLTISGTHLLYSRSVHAEVTSGAFMILGTIYYWMSCNGNPAANSTFAFLFVAGIFAGSAFCANARQFHVPPLFIAFEILRQVHFAPGYLVPRMIILCAGLFLPFFLIDQSFVLLKELGYPYWTFVKQIYERSGHLSRPDFLFRSGWLYVKNLFRCEGPLVPVFALIGAGVLISEKSFAGIMIASLMLVPLVLWSSRSPEPQKVRESSMGAYQYPVPRLVSSHIYATTIAAAVGIGRLPDLYIAPALFVVLISALLVASKIIKQRSGYGQAIAAVKSDSDGSHFTNIFEISAYYVGNDNAHNIYDLKKEEAERIYKEKGVRYFLFVPSIHENTCRLAPMPFEKDFPNARKTYAVDVGIGEFMPILIDEHNNLDPKIFRPNQIEIYDMKPYFDSRSATAA